MITLAWMGDKDTTGQKSLNSRKFYQLLIEIDKTVQFFFIRSSHPLVFERLRGKNRVMDWVYLSPHFDDVALSCGGLLWEQRQAAAQVGVWTVCAGLPLDENFSPFAQLLHERWHTGPQAIEQRRAEDQAACAEVGALYRHFDLPDCIYRRAPGALVGDFGEFLYPSEQSLFASLHPAENRRIEQLSRELAGLLSPHTQVVCPLALGGHVDHQLVRAAAEGLGHRLWYYADFPYVLKDVDYQRRLEEAGWAAQVFPVSPSGLAAWQRAVACHQSQISTFWPDLGAMRSELAAYLETNGGSLLWRSP